MMQKKMLAILLSVLMVFTMSPVTAFAGADGQAAVFADTGGQVAGFADMPDNWSTAALVKAVDNGLLKGYEAVGKTLIKADAPLKRAEMAAVVNRAFGATVAAQLKGVSDVPSWAWYAKDMGKAVQMGTFALDKKMRPESNITRQEAFAVLARAFKITATDAEHKALGNYADKADIAAWAQKDLDAMAAAGYIKGSPDGKLNPKANITRAEFAVVMDSLVKQYIDKPGEVTEVATAGNVMVRAAGVTLKGVAVKGDLIIADGVGNGEATLDGVKVEGRAVIRGGGVNSIVIKGDSSVGKVVVARADGEVRIAAEGGAKVEVIVIDDGKDNVLIEGKVGAVEVTTASVPVVIQNATVGTVTVAVESATLSIAKDSAVQDVKVAEAAKGASLAIAGTVTNVVTQAPKTEIAVTGTVTKVEAAPTASAPVIKVNTGATIQSVVTSAPNTVVSGEGTVAKVEAKAGANETKIETPKTQITVAQGVSGTTGGGGAAIAGGSTVSNSESGAGVQPATPPSTGGGGGSKTVAVSGVSLDKTELIITKGSIATTLTATLSPSNATNKTVSWTSSNVSIAAVTNDGVVTPGDTVGTTTITATTADGGFTASCTVSLAIYVDASDAAATGTYKTIQLALDAAKEGNTIVVAAGTYDIGTLNLSKSVSLIGQVESTILNGTIKFTDSADIGSVSIKNLKLQANTEKAALIKIPSSTSVAALMIDRTTLEASGIEGKAVYAGDSSGNGKITKLELTNSTIKAFYPVYIDHEIGSLDIRNNQFDITNSGLRGVVIHQFKPAGSIAISGNTFNISAASTGAIVLPLKNTSQAGVTLTTISAIHDNQILGTFANSFAGAQDIKLTIDAVETTLFKAKLTGATFDMEVVSPAALVSSGTGLMAKLATAGVTHVEGKSVTNEQQAVAAALIEKFKAALGDNLNDKTTADLKYKTIAIDLTIKQGNVSFTYNYNFVFK